MLVRALWAIPRRLDKKHFIEIWLNDCFTMWSSYLLGEFTLEYSNLLCPHPQLPQLPSAQQVSVLSLQPNILFPF